MTTSAKVLQDLLTKTQKSPGDLKILDAMASHLGLIGENADVKALECLRTFIFQVEEDLENGGFDNETKRFLLSFLNPFAGVKNFGHVGQNISAAQSNILKNDSIFNLTSIHAALLGKVERIDISEELLGYVDVLRGLREEIAASNLPDEIRELLIKRLSQMISLLENFKYFGAEALTDEIEGLIGTMVVRNYDVSDGLEKKVNGKLKSTLSGLLLGLSALATTAKNGSTIVENVPKIYSGGKLLIEFFKSP